jgi:hypothetical protein
MVKGNQVWQSKPWSLEAAWTSHSVICQIGDYRQVTVSWYASVSSSVKWEIRVSALCGYCKK